MELVLTVCGFVLTECEIALTVCRFVLTECEIALTVCLCPYSSRFCDYSLLDCPYSSRICPDGSALLLHSTHLPLQFQRFFYIVSHYFVTMKRNEVMGDWVVMIRVREYAD